MSQFLLDWGQSVSLGKDSVDLDDFMEITTLLLCRKAEHSFQHCMWYAPDINIEFDSLFHYLQESMNVSEIDLVSWSYNSLIRRFIQSVEELDCDEFDNWINKNVVLKYWLYYTVQHLSEDKCNEDVLRSVMPFAFQLIDNYWVQNKVIGLKIFNYILKTVSGNELSVNLLKTLFDQIIAAVVYKELEVVVLLFPLLDLIYTKLDENIQFDVNEIQLKLFKDVLSEMERSCTATFRKVYAKTMRDLLPKIGLSMTMYLKRLVNALFVYIQWPDEELKLLSIQIVEYLCKKLWPRIPNHSKKLLEAFFISYEEIQDSKSSELIEKHQYIIQYICSCSLQSKTKHIIKETIESLESSGKYPKSIEFCRNDIKISKIL